MTVAEWMTCADPIPMLEFLRGKVSDRKLRLFAVACCRRIEHLLHDSRSRQAIMAADRSADGQATDLELLSASDSAYAKACADAFAEESVSGSHPVTSPYDADVAAANSAWPNISQVIMAVSDMTSAIESAYHPDIRLRNAGTAAQCKLLRDIFGNPFRKPCLNPSWLSATVNDFVRQFYHERAFDCLPMLASALEAAGCHEEDVLSHCRAEGPHVRGCWVIDLLLGKHP